MATKTKTNKAVKPAKTEKKAEPCKKQCEKKCAKADKAGKADKPCEKAAAPKAVDKQKIADTLKKVPQWIVRAQSELKQLIERLRKLDEFLSKLLAPFGGDISWNTVRKARGTKAELRNIRLLMKQRDAMKAYADILSERILSSTIE